MAKQNRTKGQTTIYKELHNIGVKWWLACDDCPFLLKNMVSMRRLPILIKEYG
jgi:hypothetical protein